MRGPGAEDLRVDELLAGPYAGERVQAVGERLAEDDDVGLDVEVLHRPHLAGAAEAHLDLVVDHEDAVLLADRGHALEVVLRRDDVAAGALHRFDEQRAELGSAGLRVPGAGVFVLEAPLEFGDALIFGALRVALVRGAERIRIRDELRAVGELAERFAIPIGRGDRRGAERASVVAALEGEHALAAGRLAHQLERILDRLRAADVELYAAFQAEAALDALAHHPGELDFLAVQVLAGELRQLVDLRLERVVHRLVGVAEIDGRVPHLQIEVLAAM